MGFKYIDFMTGNRIDSSSAMSDKKLIPVNYLEYEIAGFLAQGWTRKEIKDALRNVIDILSDRTKDIEE